VDGLALGTGFVLGLRHSLDPDHVAALAQFASAEPAARRGLVFGLRWGMGHAAAVLMVLLVSMLVPARLEFGPGYEQAAELGVGMLLVGIALWRLAGVLRTEHAHLHRHANGTVHSHRHRHGLGHVHAHAPTATGFAHGAAGIVGVLALTPLAQGGALGRALVLVAFAVGSVLSMALFGALAGRLFGSLDARPRALRTAAGLTAVAGLLVGLLWIGRGL